MPVPMIIALIVGVWIIVAVVIAFVLGRTAAAGEHERELGTLRREARYAEATMGSSYGSTGTGTVTQGQ